MRILSALALSLALTAPLAAQEPAAPPAGADVVDRVVAVVGDTVLLLSDVQAAVQQMQAAGQPVPTDPVQREALLKEIVDTRVRDLVLIEAARDAGITIADEDIAEQVDGDLQALVRQRFGGDAAFEAALASEGMTRARYRQILMDDYRNRALIEQFLGQRMAGRARPLISEDQIRAAFEERKASLANRTRPASISLQQVVVRPEPSDSAREKALRTAEQVLTELRAGADFEVLAKRFSDDPGSKEHGGDLGWFKPGRMVKEFENVAFALRAGQTSGIVKSDFGYHIIRVDRVRGAERKARHILIQAEVTPADVQRARERADSVAAAIRGGASVLPLSRAYQTPSGEMEIVRIPVDRLPPAYAGALRTTPAGQVVGPLEVAGARVPSFAVVKVTERQEAGPYTLDDLREQIAAQLEQEQMTEQMIRELRNQIFVRVAM